MSFDQTFCGFFPLAAKIQLNRNAYVMYSLESRLGNNLGVDFCG